MPGVVTTPLWSLNSSTDGASSPASSSGTPAEGDYIVVMCTATQTVVNNPTLTCSDGRITFTLKQVINANADLNRMYLFVADQLVPASPIACTVTLSGFASDNASGWFIDGQRATGYTDVPTVQVGTQVNKAGSTQATATLPSPATTGDAVFAFQSANNNPLSQTPPSGWTETFDLGITTPTTGQHCMYRTNFTGSTVTWSANSGAGGAMIFELIPAATGISGSLASKSLGAVSGQITAGAPVAASAVNRTIGLLSGQGSALVSVTGGLANRSIGGLTGHLNATVPVTAALGGSVGGISGHLTGTVAQVAQLSGVIGALDGDLQAAVSASVSLSGVIGGISGHLSAENPVSGTLGGQIGLITGHLETDVVGGDVIAELHGTIGALIGSLEVQMPVICTLSGQIGVVGGSLEAHLGVEAAVAGEIGSLVGILTATAPVMGARLVWWDGQTETVLDLIGWNGLYAVTYELLVTD